MLVGDGRLTLRCRANEGRGLLALRPLKTERDSRCENVGKCEGGFEVGSLGSGGISEAA